jgi:hypothetical protein
VMSQPGCLIDGPGWVTQALSGSSSPFIGLICYNGVGSFLFLFLMFQGINDPALMHNGPKSVL